VPYLTANTAFLFCSDGFLKPNPFHPDVVVAIDSVNDKKLEALTALESQFYEGGANGSAKLMPSDPTEQQERRRRVRQGHASRTQRVAQQYRSVLEQWYGKERADKVQHAEAFELCEYGRRPNKAELAKLFPFFE